MWGKAAQVVRSHAADVQGAGLAQAPWQGEVGAERGFVETQFEFSDFQDPLLCFVRAQVGKCKAAYAAAQQACSDAAAEVATGGAMTGGTAAGALARPDPATVQAATVVGRDGGEPGVMGSSKSVDDARTQKQGGSVRMPGPGSVCTLQLWCGASCPQQRRCPGYLQRGRLYGRSRKRSKKRINTDTGQCRHGG